MNRSSDKKVLVITYYWPPSGGSGVQRWLKFIKYLPQMDWHPFVFTPENPAFNVKDPTLLRDVPESADIIHFPIWEPYHLFERINSIRGRTGKAEVDLPDPKSQSLLKRMGTWIRANLLIPDPRRFWVSPSVKFLQPFLKDNNIKTVITTGPPHSMHLIGLRLKQQNPSLRWIADFRDPWSEWGFFDSLGMTSAVRRIHKRLERQVLNSADVVTTITPFYVRHFERLGGRKVELLTNGFDEDDFATVKVIKAEKFIIRHVGIVNEKCNPRPFLDALAECVSEDLEFASNVKVEFIGQVFKDVVEYCAQHLVLRKIVTFVPTMPHKELLPLYGSSALLLLVLHGYKDAEGYMPGKLFEYAATGIKVMGVGPVNGDAAQMMKESGIGSMFDGADKQGIKGGLSEAYANWKSNDYLISPRMRDRYSRRAITQRLTELL